MASSSDDGGPGSPYAVHESDLINQLDIESSDTSTGAPVIRGELYAKATGQLGDLSAISEDLPSESDSSWREVQVAGPASGTLRPFERAPDLSNSIGVALSPHTVDIQTQLSRVLNEERAQSSAVLPVLSSATRDPRIDVGHLNAQELFARPMQIQHVVLVCKGYATTLNEPRRTTKQGSKAPCVCTVLYCTSCYHGRPYERSTLGFYSGSGYGHSRG